MMNIKRVFKHWLYPQWLTRRAFSDAAMSRIESVVAKSELLHRGEIRFAVEGALDTAPLLRGVSARQRAMQIFAELGVWDTEANNGILIYLLLADRDVEIIVDRGYQGRVSLAQWEAICQEMENYFARGEFEVGVLHGIARIDLLLRQHFPLQNGAVNVNELPNRPLRF